MMRVCDEGRRSGGSHLSPRGVAQARTHTVAQLFFFEVHSLCLRSSNDIGGSGRHST